MLVLTVRALRDAKTAFLFPLHLLPNDIAHFAAGLPSLPVVEMLNEQCILLRDSQGASPQAKGVLLTTGHEA